MQYQPQDHTFVICAYKESRYLEKCIQSLLEQIIKSNIVISTSTPNEFVFKIAEKYKIPVRVNPKANGMASDWNFASMCSDTKLYTLCHQDDYYFKDYLDKVLNYINKVDNFLFLYTDYYEDKNGILQKSNLNMKIKRFMNIPMRFKATWKSKWVRRRILSFGNPICCPSVTFNKIVTKGCVFDNSFKNAADWDAWERMSKLNGAVIYCKDYLMAHRVHEESTTTLNILNNTRKNEDIIMFERFWPAKIARLIAKIFSFSESNNG